MKKYFEDGMTVLFQGDSVTDWGRDKTGKVKTIDGYGTGYPRFFKEMYDIMFPTNNVNFVNRGVSGNRIKDLLKRYDKDFKKVKPDFISVMIGINNTWRGFDENDPTSPEDFERDYTLLMKKIKSDFPCAKIMIIDQIVFLQHPKRIGWDDDFFGKLRVTKKIANEFCDFYVPAYDIMQDNLKNIPMNELTLDGVHPAPTGHALIATEIMKTLGIL